MLRMTMADGRTFTGRTYADLVEALRQASLIAPPSRRRYMKEVRHRVRIWNGRTLEYTTEREFCLALAAMGLVTLEGEEDLL